MKKGKLFIITFASIMSIGIALGGVQTTINSKASARLASDAISDYYTQEATSQTGVLNSVVEKKLNLKGYSDEEILDMKQEDIDTLNAINDPNSLQIVTNYYNYDETNGSVTPLDTLETATYLCGDTWNTNSNFSFMASINKLSEKLGFSPSVTYADIKEKKNSGETKGHKFKQSIVISKSNTGKRTYNVKITNTWQTRPKNRGYEILGLEASSHAPITNLSAYASYKCDGYHDEYLAEEFSLHTETHFIKTFTRKTSDFVKTNAGKLNFNPGSNKANLKTPKMPTDQMNFSISALDKSINKDLKKEGINLLVLKDKITYYLNAEIQLTTNSTFTVKPYYGHQIKKLNTDIQISANIPPSITVGASGKLSTYYEKLPSSDQVARYTIK